MLTRPVESWVSGVFAKPWYSRNFVHRPCLERVLPRRPALMVTMSSVADRVPVSQGPLPIYLWLGGTKTRMRLLGDSELSSAVCIQYYLPAVSVERQRRLWPRLNRHRSGRRAEEGVERDAKAYVLVRTRCRNMDGTSSSRGFGNVSSTLEHIECKISLFGPKHWVLLDKCGTRYQQMFYFSIS